MSDNLTAEHTVTKRPGENGVPDLQRDSDVRTDFYHRSNPDVRRFLDQTLEGIAPAELLWVRNNNGEGVQFSPGMRKGVVNLQRLNDLTDINRYLRRVNEQLPSASWHVICFESMGQRKDRIFNKFPKVIREPYYLLDFILKRVFPKFGPTRKLAHRITGGRNRVISLTEALGRLTCCGYSVVDYKEIGYLTYIVTRKTREPDVNGQPTYGALCRLRRIGLNGEMFTVYKLRTMYPYSEYLQDFVFKKNDLQEGGKLNRDFRVTSWGRWLRRFWIDELPMFYNWLRREMKIVGVRPLSQHYFDLYPEDLQKLRTRVKPGLVPPFYADMPQTFEEITESEKQYLYAYLKNPILTDIRYFFKAFFNIFFKGARSK
ncbi:MAG: sugar transferase [Cyclobacteriaceae bacterium]